MSDWRRRGSRSHAKASTICFTRWVTGIKKTAHAAELEGRPLDEAGTAALAVARRLLAEATGYPEAEIDDQASIDSLDSWDSLAHMRLILANEAETGSLVAPEAVVDLMSLADVGRYLWGQGL